MPNAPPVNAEQDEPQPQEVLETVVVGTIAPAAAIVAEAVVAAVEVAATAAETVQLVGEPEMVALWTAAMPWLSAHQEPHAPAQAPLPLPYEIE